MTRTPEEVRMINDREDRMIATYMTNCHFCVFTFDSDLFEVCKS